MTDYEQLLAGVTTGTEIHVLDPGEDAVTQITNTLLGRQNIASLHIVSHGEAGGVDFGSSVLNLTDLPQYAAQLKTWSKALTNDADILFYGCNVAEGQLGQAFVQNISQITGADVAASNNLTGKDGDWNLEVTTGNIESPLVFDSKVTSAYAYDLNILGETFKGSDVTNLSWIYNTTGTQPSLTARSTAAASTGGIPGGGGLDAVGSGALRLTSAATSQASFVIYNRPINATSGLSITFNINAYGGNGADGISFFLINGNANPTKAGAVGGSLGYSSSSVGSGLVGGYLGIGFDEFGNFSSSEYGVGGPGQRADSIAVRGSEATGYKYLAGTATLTQGIDTPGNSRSNAQKKVQIDLTPAGLLSLKIDLNNDGDFLDNNETPAALKNYNVVATNGALPSTFKFGFSASTGSQTNIHEITGLDVNTYNNAAYIPLVNFTSSNGSVSEGATSLNLTAQIDAVTSNTVTVPVTLSGTATNGTDYTLSDSKITILPQQLTGSITLNPIDNLIAGSNKTAVVTMGTPMGGAQLSPQNNVFTTTIVDNDYSLSTTGSSTYVENASPIAIAPTAMIVGGAAAPAINGATVSIGNGFSSTEDRLGIQGQSGTSGTIAGSSITWGYNTTSGVLALSGTDTAAKYQAALQQVVYSDLSDAPSTTTRAVTYTINYNSDQQATSTSTINVTAVDDSSVITPSDASSVTVVEDIATPITGITFADVDAGDGSVTATFSVPAGTLAAMQGGGVTVGGTSSSLTLNGTIANINAFIAASKLTYLTMVDSNAALTLGVSINDNGNTPDPALTTNASLTINITPVNDAPNFTATNPVTTLEDAELQTVSNWATFNPGGNTAETEQTATYTVSNLSNASLFTVAPTVAPNGTLTYTAAPNASGISTFDVVVKDSGGTDNDGVDMSMLQTFTITVSAVNDAPTLGNATLAEVAQNTTNPGGSKLSSLFGSLFSDPDTDTSLSGLAIVGNTATTQQGQWEYSIDGTTWTSVGAVADDATALALSASTLVRFIPATGYNGTPPGLTVRALDNSYSGGFTNGTTRVTVNTTINGGTTAISSGTPAALNTSVRSLSDLLWRYNSSDGLNAVWQLDGFTFQSGYYLPSVADPAWQIAASTADFNNDGIADILWRNQVTGANTIWEMNSTGYETTHTLPQVDVNWQIVTTADFNRDSTPDILWRNMKTGENAIWQMNGVTRETGYFIDPVADTNWQIAGTANFSGDSTPDILWRNVKTGENAIWQMNGVTRETGYFITPVTDTNWQIAGIADFNDDGTSDIVWRNQASGENAIWQMAKQSNGEASRLGGSYIPQVTDQNWQIVGIADFNRDGTPDILWYNKPAHKEAIWKMSGDFSSNLYLETYLLPDVVGTWDLKSFVADLNTSDIPEA
ncbi:hypothetical protein ANSO36C_08360 [Nostoc cf. commune SO-36]|uniref:Cadherin domain-containing protein n=1 Tax=Nostoc cf. commune SO-36 TaxID=449208 RepID=A0ABM7YWL9_NOSCO|nr:hypothetical protein ANSO36C_08360 [Nostoc cf. commune SO-36]